jgi:hypothetical protein
MTLFRACSCCESRYEVRVSGRSAAWLARPSGGRKVGSSNLPGPTKVKRPVLPVGHAGLFLLK